MSYSLNGLKVNALIIGGLKGGTGDYATAFRIRQYFDNGAHCWTTRNVNCFKDEKEFSEFLSENRIECVFGINAYIAGPWLINCGLPFAVIFSGSELNEKAKIPDDLAAMTAVVQGARMLVANTEAIRDKILKVWPELDRGKLVLVPRAVITRPDPTIDMSWMDVYQLDRDSFIFVMVTRLTKAKDPLQIVTVFTHFHQMHEKHPFLLIVGDKAEAEYYDEFANVIDGCPGVIYVGPRSMTETHRLIARSFALVNPSAGGGTSTCVLEAMDLGVPVIARKNAIHSKLIEHGKTGLLYTFAEDFVDKAELLLEDFDLRLNLIENAGTFVKKNFDCAKEMKEYSKLSVQLKNSSGKCEEGAGEGEAGGEGGGNDDPESGEGKQQQQFGVKESKPAEPGSIGQEEEGRKAAKKLKKKRSKGYLLPGDVVVTSKGEITQQHNFHHQRAEGNASETVRRRSSEMSAEEGKKMTTTKKSTQKVRASSITEMKITKSTAKCSVSKNK